jgi:Mn2+/Fe2+ NRAMP family transporter
LYRKFKHAVGFYVVIAVATLVGLLINFLGIDPIKALVFTAVFNGIAAVPLLFMIAKVGNNRSIMGEYKNGTLSNLGIRAAFALMAVSALFLLYAFITGQA